MRYGFCPECNIPAKRTLFSASCEKCGVALKPSGKTVLVKIIISLSATLAAFLAAKNGTQEIIAVTSENLSNVLFWYYMKLFLAALAVSYTGQFIVHQWFTAYVPAEDNNT